MSFAWTHLSSLLWSHWAAPLGCQLHHTAQCLRQSCWRCTRSHCPCHQKDVKQCQSHYGPLRGTTFHCSLLAHWATRPQLFECDHPANSLSKNFSIYQIHTFPFCRQGDVVKCFTHNEVDGIGCSFLTHQHHNPSSYIKEEKSQVM